MPLSTLNNNKIANFIGYRKYYTKNKEKIFNGIKAKKIACRKNLKRNNENVNLSVFADSKFEEKISNDNDLVDIICNFIVLGDSFEELCMYCQELFNYALYIKEFIYSHSIEIIVTAAQA